MNWKTIPSCLKYEASTCGKIRRIGSQSPLKSRIRPDGYSQAVIYNEIQKPSYKYTHRLVAETWINPIPKGYQVNHKDGDKSNNAVINLEIVTPSENMFHAYKNGLTYAPGMVGSKHHKSTTNEAEVLEIRQKHKTIKSLKKMCALYPHIKAGTLGNIIYRQSWKHVS